MKLSAVIIRLALNTMVAAAIIFAIVGSSICCAATTSTQDTTTNGGSNVVPPSSSSSSPSSFVHPSSDQPVDGIAQVGSLVLSNRSSRKCDLFVEEEEQQEQQQQAIVAVDEVDDDQPVAPKSVTTISDTDVANGDIRTLTESRSGEVPATITSVALPLPSSSSSSSSGEPSSDQPVDANVEGATTMLMTVFDLIKKFQGSIISLCIEEATTMLMSVFDLIKESQGTIILLYIVEVIKLPQDCPAVDELMYIGILLQLVFIFESSPFHIESCLFPGISILNLDDFATLLPLSLILMLATVARLMNKTQNRGLVATVVVLTKTTVISLLFSSLFLLLYYVIEYAAPHLNHDLVQLCGQLCLVFPFIFATIAEILTVEGFNPGIGELIMNLHIPGLGRDGGLSVGRRMVVVYRVYVEREGVRLVRGWLGERGVRWVVAALVDPVGNGPQVGVAPIVAPVGNVLQVGAVAIKLPNLAEVSHDTITNIGGECIICNFNKAICVTLPCAHISYCVGCALIVGGGQNGNTPKNIGQLQCSLCKVDITDIKRAFFP